MDKFKKLFNKEIGVVIGMIHVDALPGTPKHDDKKGIQSIIAKAVQEAKIYVEAGVDGIAIENMHDVPYMNTKVGPEIVATMSVIAANVKQVTGNVPVGIQVLAAANKEAIAIAHAANLQFVRVEGFVFSHVADEGMMNSCAGEILRYRKQIGADNVLVWTDIKKKHSAHAITSDVNIVDTAHAAEFFMSDGVIITGVATGMEASVEECIAVKKGVKIPVIVGSGVSADNLEKYIFNCNAMIIGSYFKEGGNWENEVSLSRTKDFMERVYAVEKKQ